MSEVHSFIGLDVGGTNLKACAFTASGELLAETSAPTSDDGTPAWREPARSLVRSVIARCPTPSRIGVAAPGLPAQDGRSIAHLPNRLAGLEGLVWQEWLETTRPVPVLNDAQAALLAEVWLGAARGAKNVVLLTLGTGVGGAAMVDGHILRGHLGRAGHLGHVSLNPDGPRDIVNTPGSLEDAVGECSFALRSQGKFSSTRELVEAYRRGLPDAKRVWLRSVRDLAAGIVGFINVLDPELVVIGGGMANADAALFEPLALALDEFEWRPDGARVRLVKAALGSNAGATGAAYAAKLAASENLQIAR